MFPRYAHSFGTFQYAYPLMPGIRAFMPPQGMLLIASAIPKQWEVRFIDENLRDTTAADLQWADAVFLSGMHVQRRHIDRLNTAAHRFNKLTVLGGPSVSGCPDYYPSVDMLHIGEIGDATEAIFRRIDESVARPTKQEVYTTSQRLDMERFPTPAYHLLDMRQYFMGTVQFSSGCPFLCEFCDIPALYGRSPRMKQPEQVIRELDLMLERGVRTGVYFVDDNFIANPAAARALLPHLIQWQERHGYPVRFSCEATLNIAQMPDILEMMKQALFVAIFVGIETPEAEALTLIQKKQNMRQPILESIATLNKYGIEVVSGIILGLDSDTPQTPDNILKFIEISRIPMLTINLLYALPKTTLYARLEKEGRLSHDMGRASNVVFKMPHDTVLSMWKRVIAEAYEPARLFDRFKSQAEICFPNRINPKRKVSASTVKFGLGVIRRTLWEVGVKADYRKLFWNATLPALKQGRIEDVIHIGSVSHHLIKFTRDCAHGHSEASFYADPSQNAFNDEVAAGV